MVQKIDFKKLNKFKKSIIAKRKKSGLQSAINFSEGILGLRRGEFMKHRPKIRTIIKKFNQ